MDYCVITFDSTNDALKAETLLSEYGGTIIPVPSEIDADCGFAVRLPKADEAINILKNSAKLNGVYGVTGKGKHKTVEKIDFDIS